MGLGLQVQTIPLPQTIPLSTPETSRFSQPHLRLALAAQPSLGCS